jgi:hypothetical protein
MFERLEMEEWSGGRRDATRLRRPARRPGCWLRPCGPPRSAADAADAAHAADRRGDSDLEAALRTLLDASIDGSALLPTLAAEAPAGYDAGAAPVEGSLAEAVAWLDAAIGAAGRVDLAVEQDHAVLDAFTRLQELGNRLDALRVALVGQITERQAYRVDGSPSTAAWVKARTGMDHAAAQRLVNAAGRIADLPRIGGLFARGVIGLAHVEAVTQAAIPQRAEAVAGAQDTVVELLEHGGSPHDVRRVLRRLEDLVEPDGRDGPDPDSEPICPDARDPRRELHLSTTFERLWRIDGYLDPYTGEKLAALLDALDTPDAPDTPVKRRRSAAQRRADAFEAILDRGLASRDLPTVHGSTPHVLVSMDLATLLGADDGTETLRTPRLRYFGDVTPEQARRIAWQARMSVVLTMGPWRVVTVGRQQRRMPDWMRALLVMIHGHCRGPDCDRPITWSQAHHITDWTDGGHTDFNDMIPLCLKQHTTVTIGEWDVTYDPDEGTVTWTHTRTGRTRIIRPPPP